MSDDHWALWARSDLAARGQRLVVPRTDRTQLPRDRFPQPQDARVATDGVLVALLEDPRSVGVVGMGEGVLRFQPMASFGFFGHVWIGGVHDDQISGADLRYPGVRIEGRRLQNEAWRGAPISVVLPNVMFFPEVGSVEYRNHCGPRLAELVRDLLRSSWGPP